MTTAFRNFIFATLAITTVALGACGGGGASAPKPLAHKYDEVHIAQFSLEEKAAVLAAQNEYQRARAEEMKLQSEQSELATKISVAKNERKQALLAEQSAREENKAAESGADRNKINAAAKNMRVKELERRAADEKVTYLQKKMKYIKKQLRYRQEETYHQEARYEYEKAKLGEANNIAPRGVDYANYKKQVDDRSRNAQRARQNAASEKAKADKAEAEWKKRVAEANQAKGTATPEN